MELVRGGESLDTSERTVPTLETTQKVRGVKLHLLYGVLIVQISV